MRATVGLLAFLSAGVLTPPARSATEARPRERVGHWLPALCLDLLQEEAGEDPVRRRSPEARWNLHYERGYAAIEKGDLDAAARSHCAALAAAAAFPRGDVRVAETLDELGLVSFMRSDYPLAEALQGAATAEILLALGPPARDLSEKERDHCSHSFSTYVGRLGQVFTKLERPGDLRELEEAPYRILARGYVPAASLAPRLEWLVSRYLLAEDMAAVAWLRALQDEIAATVDAP